MKINQRFISIRTKVYACSFVMIILGAFLCSIGTFWAVRSDILEKSKMDYQLLTNNLISSINASMKDTVRYSELLITDREIIDYLQNIYNGEKNYSYFLAQSEIEDKINNLEAMGSTLISNIVIFDRNGAVIPYGAREESLPFKGEELGMDYNYTGFYEAGGSFYYICPIAGNAPDKKIGRIVVDIKPDVILSPMNMINADNLYVAVLNGDGESIAENGKEGDHYEFMGYRTLMQPDWQVVAMINEDILTQSLYQVGRVIVVLLMAVLGISYFILKPTLKLITEPLALLTDKIKNFDIDDVNELVVPVSNDEVGMIAKEYKRMAERVRSLVFRLRKQKETEVDLYMAQVNPHFIYNTLYALICVAENRNETEIADKIKSVANILCFSLYHALDSFHSIEEEMGYINQYIDILKYKYGAGLKVKWDIRGDIKKEKIGVLLLYPLVENSVFHGLSAVEKKVLSVEMKGQDEEIVISVMDNGIGMSHEDMYEIQSRLEESMRQIQGEDTGMEIDKTHMGLLNLKLRLYFLYGRDSDIRIESARGKGTKVTINIRRQDSSFKLKYRELKKV